MMERWRSLGGTIGLREWDIKNGSDEALTSEAEVEVEETKSVPAAVEVDPVSSEIAA